MSRNKNPAPISPSALVCASLGLEQAKLAFVSDVRCSCGLCGADIDKNAPVGQFRPDSDFSSEHLHPRRAHWTCNSCATVLAHPMLLTGWSRAVFCQEGAYRMSTASDITWMLTQAPTPFVAVYNTRKAAHMVWQTPVTHDKRVIHATWGRVTGTIRTGRVQAAYEALARLADHASKTNKAAYAWPVHNLTLRDDEAAMCQLMPSHEHSLRKSEDDQVLADLDSFDSLSQCERWALSAVLLTSTSRTTPWAKIAPTTPPRISNNPKK